jgi:hypothetical protein
MDLHGFSLMPVLVLRCSPPITTVGRFDTVEAAQLATDEVWDARSMF